MNLSSPPFKAICVSAYHCILQQQVPQLILHWVKYLHLFCFESSAVPFLVLMLWAREQKFYLATFSLSCIVLYTTACLSNLVQLIIDYLWTHLRAPVPVQLRGGRREVDSLYCSLSSLVRTFHLLWGVCVCKIWVLILDGILSLLDLKFSDLHIDQ